MDNFKDLITRKKESFLRSIGTVGIVGAGVSGISCARLAKSLGKRVKVTEADKDISKDALESLKALKAELEIGRHSQEFLKDADLVVLSPGVDTDAFRRAYLGGMAMPCVGEIEFSYWFCKSNNIIAITGTNGKTSTTFIVGDILKANTSRPVHVLGNIGSPFASSVLEIGSQDYVVLEISSFQLETIYTFKPHVSCLLNLFQDHLDRYPDMSGYFQAKKRIFINQDEGDFAVFPEVLKEDLSYIKAKKIIVRGEDNSSFIKNIVGIYNIEESLVDRYFEDFKGLSHRLEFVDKKGQISFINDSKATNVSSTAFALKRIKAPVILIAGGLDKGIDYSRLKPYLQNVRQLILIGQAKDKIREDLKGSVDFKDCSSLEEAVSIAYNKARAGDTVLLSPMCASFDMFEDYKERGEAFKKAVKQLK